MWTGRRHRSRSPIWRWLERGLFATAALALGFVVYVSAEAHLYQSMENRELDRLLSSAAISAASQPDGSPAVAGADASPLDAPTRAARAPRPARRTEPAPTSRAQRRLVGRIEIPRLGVSAVILSGVDARTLQLAVGHIPGTALPGQPGNIGLAGHRDTFFRRLRDVRAGDEVRLVTPDGVFGFTVEDTSIVSPQDTWVLDPTNGSALTLVTCYPFTYLGSAPDRFIVRAVGGTASAPSGL